jgi:hypothetical protein
MTDHDRVASTVAAWRTAGERGDANAAVACLAEDVTLISPLTAMFRFRGREQMHELLTAAFQVITEIRYHTEVGGDATRALFYYGRCGGEELEEAQLLRFNSNGEIAELTLFGRPLPALTEVMKRLGPVLLHRQGRPGLARAISAASAPLAAMARAGDRRIVPLADPNRTR